MRWLEKWFLPVSRNFVRNSQVGCIVLKTQLHFPKGRSKLFAAKKSAKRFIDLSYSILQSHLYTIATDMFSRSSGRIRPTVFVSLGQVSGSGMDEIAEDVEQDRGVWDHWGGFFRKDQWPPKWAAKGSGSQPCCVLHGWCFSVARQEDQEGSLQGKEGDEHRILKLIGQMYELGPGEWMFKITGAERALFDEIETMRPLRIQKHWRRHQWL